MSEEDEGVEKLVASIMDALTRRDPDALLALCHPEYEFRSRLVAVEGGVYRGPEGFRDYFRDLDEGFADARWEVNEVLGTPEEGLLVVFRVRAVGRASGAPVDVLTAQVWQFRDGRIWRNTVYASRSEALEAAGLSE